MTDFKMTNQVLCKMTECAQKMTECAQKMTDLMTLKLLCGIHSDLESKRNEQGHGGWAGVPGN